MIQLNLSDLLNPLVIDYLGLWSLFGHILLGMVLLLLLVRFKAKRMKNTDASKIVLENTKGLAWFLYRIFWIAFAVEIIRAGVAQILVS